MPELAGREQEVWDVFISHRGADNNADIKMTFVSFLHARLQQAGITAFMDEESLEAGDNAWTIMTDAVSRCRIAVPVLTECFGNSLCCLEELALMVKARRHIMPLFLAGDFDKLLEQIKSSSNKLRNRVSQETFQSWQEAIDSVFACTGLRQDQFSR